jgi:hypothetical protein
MEIVMLLLSLIIFEVITFRIPENATDNFIISDEGHMWEWKVFAIIISVFILFIVRILRIMLNVHE